MGMAVAMAAIFDLASLAAEHRLAETQGQAGPGGLHLRALPDRRRHRAQRLGVEGVLAHADAARPLGGLYAAALLGGAALYLAGKLLFKQRMHRTLSLPRLVAAGVLVAALPAAIALPPLAGLAGLVLILAALLVVETARYAQARRSLRNS
ncbi:MAG TPA: low temperature requirement protein A [Actinomycetota bacterium]